MARGKRKQQYRKQLEEKRRKASAQAKGRPSVTEAARVGAVGAGAGTARAAASSVSPVQDNVDIPWTAERPQPVRRAFGVFKVGRIDFIGHRSWFYAFSGTLILIGLVSLLFRGPNYSIDFTGGNAYTLRFSQPVAEDQLRAVLGQQGISNVVIRVDRSDPDQAIVRTPYLDPEAEAKMLDTVKARFGEVEATSGDAVSPTIGGELVRNAVIGTILACLGILIYVAVRFEYRFATAGVLALVHDVLITTGIFSLFHLEVDSAFIAALLTIVGYSINDTIVVFDRIRDNLKRRGKETLEALANRSINETFVRSVNTSATAFLAITAIYLLGGATTRNFALALMIGIFFGTYSSICVATPIWLWWRKRDERVLAASSSAASSRPRAARARG